MSDLQCAATVVVLPADWPMAVGRLRSERPAAVLAGPGVGDTASDLAQLLDVSRQDLPDDASSPAGLTRALDELADEYRGECVAVVMTPTVLAALTRMVLPAGEAGAVVVRIDADGHRWAPWPPALTDSRDR